MEITILSDNKSSGNLQSEHGLSILIKHNNQTILFDTGASDLFIRNAKSLGILIADIDILILSHGHNDHTGGLKYFLENNSKATIYLSSAIAGKKYYSLRNEIKRDISTDEQLIITNKKRFIFIRKTTFISPDIALICQFENKYPLPKANNRLSVKDKNGEQPDNFTHETVLAINTSDRIVIFSGCCHNGLLNILDTCTLSFPQKEIIACIGGTHLIDNHETVPEIEETARFIKTNYPQLKLHTGHCTGECATTTFKKILKHNFFLFYTSYSITI